MKIANKILEQSILSKKARFYGNIIQPGNLIVKGLLEGNIDAEGFVKIESKAAVKGDIKAHSCKIKGNCRGNLNIEDKLEIQKDATFHGKVSARIINIHKDAEVKLVDSVQLITENEKSL